MLACVWWEARPQEQVPRDAGRVCVEILFNQESKSVMMIHPDLIALWALINFSPCMRIGTGCRCNGLLSPMPAAPSPLEDAGFIIVPAAQARKFDFGSAQFAA